METKANLAKFESRKGAVDPFAGGAPDYDPAPPWKKIHAVLRGRYRWLFLVAVPMALAGFYLGYRSEVPVYRSTGMVRIEPVLPKILYPTEDNRLMPLFEEYVADKASLFKSRKIIDLALQHPVLAGEDLGSDPQAHARFNRSVSIKRKRTRIEVHFDDTDPVFAQKAMNALIDTYKKQFDENETQAFQNNVTQLERRRNQLQAEMDSVKESILSVADGGNFEDVRLQWTRASEIARARKSELDKIDLQIRLITERLEQDDGIGSKTETTSDSKTWTVQQIALLDDRMDGLLMARDSRKRAMAKDLETYGPEHRVIRDHREAIAEADRAIEVYAERWRLRQKARGVEPSPG
ncbi:MAG: hypothetical protein R3236_09170, partial [Phycisphaeraceae bacterium]|nr:hypothetical protein [Phycisphaeraceae bacterium]